MDALYRRARLTQRVGNQEGSSVGGALHEVHWEENQQAGSSGSYTSGQHQHGHPNKEHRAPAEPGAKANT